MGCCSVYGNRTYRKWVSEGGSGLRVFELTRGQSNMQVSCEGPLEMLADASLSMARREIEAVIEGPGGGRFASSLCPVSMDADQAPSPVVAEMLRASGAWNVGPMACVAGAIAERVGRDLGRLSSRVIVENGGDVFAIAPGDISIALFPGERSPFPRRITFTVSARGGVGVCTSSGRFGHSLSFGQADAVVAIAGSGAEADAAATAIANSIRAPEDVEAAMSDGALIGRLRGLLVCCGDRIGVGGSVRLDSAGRGAGTGGRQVV
ncbi:UPF0280 family protein [Candidatus Fermentibacterales bacterium]|nr:UPF0280 family protein [Candidatus Fermentibacterales bacterium]